ncbi:4'-phosphopantetheinyl transferase superfamily protein [Actinoplanes oblitus]|uniref:4'-phosphopantetheinyl transferase superfamily protein n=1 Tax=Actinoplanes oblitus TaxID=3040509 RepID=A0ABY8WRV4_9ACTN|nr:4'-phosphopantetheinyl transferase superfamily protein [Actinoplanes oblitus]WIN00188.1 4'-phosphopantetheinyl transferase superfamily protein [Actinoplanes oblitus]
MSAPREPGPVVVGPPPGTDVWHIVLDVDPEAAVPVGALLDDEERRRAGRLRDSRAATRFVVAHGAVRSVLAGYLGATGGTLHWARGPNGKPYFDGPWRRWQWSLSRSGGHAMLAVRLHDPVGVDLEEIRNDVRATALAARFMPPDEAAAVSREADQLSRSALYHRLLSRKEACVKASGGRLLDGLCLRVLVPGIVEGTGAYDGERWDLRDLPAPPGFVATLATVGDRPQRLRMFEWDWRSRREDPVGIGPHHPEPSPDGPGLAAAGGLLVPASRGPA